MDRKQGHGSAHGRHRRRLSRTRAAPPLRVPKQPLSEPISTRSDEDAQDTTPSTFGNVGYTRVTRDGSSLRHSHDAEHACQQDLAVTSCVCSLRASGRDHQLASFECGVGVFQCWLPCPSRFLPVCVCVEGTVTASAEPVERHVAAPLDETLLSCCLRLMRIRAGTVSSRCLCSRTHTLNSVARQPLELGWQAAACTDGA